MREAKKLTGFLCTSDSREGGPIKPSRDSSDLSSLDLDRGETSAPDDHTIQTVPIVKSIIMENTKKHLSAALYNLHSSLRASLTWKLVRADSFLTSMHIYCYLVNLTSTQTR